MAGEMGANFFHFCQEAQKRLTLKPVQQLHLEPYHWQPSNTKGKRKLTVKEFIHLDLIKTT